jgi:hypothetical protein
LSSRRFYRKLCRLFLVSAPDELAGLFCRGAVQQPKRTLVAASAVAVAAAAREATAMDARTAEEAAATLRKAWCRLRLSARDPARVPP